MKLLIFGKNSENIEPLIRNLGFEVVNEKADVVTSYGGDGTLLSSERKYPGIPKLPIRDSLVCKKCPFHETENLLKLFSEGKLKLKEYAKLESQVSGQKLLALNDFVIRNQEPTHTIRFKVNSGKLLIGDGTVISTPFGSSGYFKSITRKTFQKGFALAYNNTTEKMPIEFFDSNNQINFELVRGKATLSSDNNPDIYIIPEGTKLTFKLSKQVAKIYELESLRCPNCRVVRG